MDIHNSYTLRNWVSLYQRKIQTGLFVSPMMTNPQKQDVYALRQRNQELEQTFQEANLLIRPKVSVVYEGDNDFIH